jgi:hypothetical protein
MAAPERFAETSDSSCTAGAVHTWHVGTLATVASTQAFHSSTTRPAHPPKCIGATKQVIHGDPEPALINISFADRQNLAMRMCMKWLARLTNAFSKKFENDCHTLVLYFFLKFLQRSQDARSKARYRNAESARAEPGAHRGTLGRCRSRQKVEGKSKDLPFVRD